MNASPATTITKAASKQTYFTIRFLVDPARVEDAYQAYAYFRWVDDVLDADTGWRSERLAFLERQKSLMERCYAGEPPQDVNLQESMLVKLIHYDLEENSGLSLYLHNMMRVMDFDVKRRGLLVSQAELNEYTFRLSSAVIEALHYFIGHDDYTPHDETRTLAVSGAHIAHMLRDTYNDLQAGYYNIPREVLEANDIRPEDVHSEAYRLWVKDRVQLAREYFEAGKLYFKRVDNRRARLAGLAYMARFEWLLDTIERENYYLRPEYNERKRIGTGLRMSWQALSSMANLREAGALPGPVASHPMGKL